MVRRVAIVLVLILAAAGGVRPAFAASAAASAGAAGSKGKPRPITVSPAAAAPAGRVLAPLSEGELAPLPPLDERVPRPEAVLGYPVGARFTHWNQILSYLQTVAGASDRVKLWEYGKTYEGRPLELVAISSPQNLARLDQLRAERLRLADPGTLSRDERETLAKSLPVAVWLAYGIHGDEASSAEAAMAVAYVLAAGQGDIPELLKSTIVLIDPLSNPDGRERYIRGYEERQGSVPDPRAAAAEHFQPWPGGRQNHYLVDLNRDWAWASQQESRARIAAYQSWEPQVYVDFHEMGSESSYFFPPPSEPVNNRIERRILTWIETFGRANAQAFDRQGWVYFKSEDYDLFYPGYGDSYPSLRGAVGMTYEMAGGGRGGLALTLPDGAELTLADRVAHHFTTSLVTVRTAAANAHRLLADFAANRAGAAGESARSFLWTADRPEARALADLLALHGIRVRQLGGNATVRAKRLAHGGGAGEDRRFPAGTYVVSTAQPLGNLVGALMDLDSPMSSGFLDRQRQRLEQNLKPEFYDITAWSLPLAYGVEAWVAAGDVAGARPLAPAAGGLAGSAALGALVRPQGLASYRLEAELQRRGIRHRVALASFTVGPADYPAGTLFIPRRGNSADFDKELAAVLAGEIGLPGGASDPGLPIVAQGIDSSFEVTGLSLGSGEMAPVRAARVGLLSGEGVDATSFGFLWHLLDREVGLRHDRLDLARLAQLDLSEFDVLVVPEGEYDNHVSEKTRLALDAWVKNGGLLVAIGGAVLWLQDHQMTAIKKWEPPKTADDPESSGSEDAATAEQLGLAGRPIFTPGAALATRMQRHHPLTIGLASSPAVLYEGSLVLRATGDPQKDVLVATDEHPVIAGFAFPEAEQRLSGSLLVGTESRGKGALVLFAEDPDFRLFWHATAPIFLNALLYGPSVGLGAR
jgi:hypothetical protein